MARASMYRVLKAEPESDDDVECLGYVDAKGKFRSLDKKDVDLDDGSQKKAVKQTNKKSVAKPPVLPKTEPISEDDDIEFLGYVDTAGNFRNSALINADRSKQTPKNPNKNKSVAKHTVFPKTESLSEDNGKDGNILRKLLMMGTVKYKASKTLQYGKKIQILEGKNKPDKPVPPKKMLLSGKGGGVKDKIHKQQPRPSDYGGDKFECPCLIVKVWSMTKEEWLNLHHEDVVEVAVKICRGAPKDHFPASAARQQPQVIMDVEPQQIKIKPGVAAEPQPSISAVAGPSARQRKQPLKKERVNAIEE